MIDKIKEVLKPLSDERATYVVNFNYGYVEVKEVDNEEIVEIIDGDKQRLEHRVKKSLLKTY